MDPINTLPLEGWAYKITDRPCTHFKDGRHKGDCSTCTREVLAQAVETETSKLRAEMEGRDKEWYGKLQGADEALHLANLQIAEKDKAMALLVERLRGLLPHRGGTMPCDGPGCNFCNDEEAVAQKPLCDLAICGWCSGTGKEYGTECPKCHGAGGFAQKRICGASMGDGDRCGYDVPCHLHGCVSGCLCKQDGGACDYVYERGATSCRRCGCIHQS